jgi:predicted choloylglycine hydrolase
MLKGRWWGFLLFAVLLSISVPGHPAGFLLPAPSAQLDDLYQHYDDDFVRLLNLATRQMGKPILKYEAMAPGSFPKKATVTGTHYELGLLVGLIARNYGMQVLRRNGSNADMNARITEMYRNIYPQFLEKARGIGQAFGITLDDLDLRYLEHDFEAELWWRLFKYQEFTDFTGFSVAKPVLGCSLTSYYLEGERRQLIGRNFDNRADRPGFLVVSSLDGVYKTIGHSIFQLYQWLPDGINERGLFMGMASLSSPQKYADYKDSPDYPDRPAIQAVHLERVVLDTCATVDEALALIGKTRVWFPVEFNHFLLSDSLGKSVVVEFDKDKNMVVLPRQAPFHVVTNTALQEGTDYVYGACWRYRTATDGLQQGISSMPDLSGVMESVRPQSGYTRTLWTAMADLSRKEMTVSYRSENYAISRTFSFSSTRLTWAQLALGGGYECMLLLSNKRETEWSGQLHLRQGNDEGWSGSWSLDGLDRTGSDEIAVTIAPRSTVKMCLSGDSTVRSGYLQLTAEGAFSVYDVAPSYFYRYLAGGRLQESVGSAAAPSGRAFSFPVERTATTDTGLAWAPDSVTAPFSIILSLYDRSGSQLRQKTLPYGGHEARFVSELFENIPDGFLGRVRVESEQNIHLEVLRLDQTDSGFQITSTPPDRVQ